MTIFFMVCGEPANRLLQDKRHSIKIVLVIDTRLGKSRKPFHPSYILLAIMLLTVKRQFCKTTGRENGEESLFCY